MKTPSALIAAVLASMALGQTPDECARDIGREGQTFARADLARAAIGHGVEVGDAIDEFRKQGLRTFHSLADHPSDQALYLLLRKRFAEELENTIVTDVSAATPVAALWETLRIQLCLAEPVTEETLAAHSFVLVVQVDDTLSVPMQAALHAIAQSPSHKVLILSGVK